MGKISRRDLLRQTAVIGAGLALPLGAVNVASAVAPAAIVAAVLAVASFVAGQIANHNRRNPEIYELGAALRELQVIEDQIASLQTSMALILEKLSNQAQQTADIVAHQSVRDLHRDILAEVNLFDREMNNYPPTNDADLLRNWLHSDAERDQRLLRYHETISRTMERLSVSDFPCDASAPMVLKLACDTEFKLMVLRNLQRGQPRYDRDYIVRTAEHYRQLLQRVKDPTLKVKDCAAWYLTAHETARLDILAKIDANPLGSLLNAYKGSCPDRC
jgi:hypothetical protein